MEEHRSDKEMKTSCGRTGSPGRMLSKGGTGGFAEVAAKGKHCWGGQGLHGGGGESGCPSPGAAGLPELGLNV